MVVDEFFLVLPDSPFEFVCEAIDGRIHVRFSVVGVDPGAINADGRLSLMAEFFNCQDAMHIRNQVKVSFYFVELAGNIFFQWFTSSAPSPVWPPTSAVFDSFSASDAPAMS